MEEPNLEVGKYYLCESCIDCRCYIKFLAYHNHQFCYDLILRQYGRNKIHDIHKIVGYNTNLRWCSILEYKPMKITMIEKSDIESIKMAMEV